MGEMRMDLTLLETRSESLIAYDQMYTQTKPSISTLSHHGIKGMKWGVRNGPPYPLTTKLHAKVTKSGSGHLKEQHRKNISIIESSTSLSNRQKRRLIDIENEEYKKALKDQEKIDKGKEVAKKVLVGAGVVTVASLAAYGLYKYGKSGHPENLDAFSVGNHGAGQSTDKWLKSVIKERYPGVQNYTNSITADMVCSKKFFSHDFWNNTLNEGERLGVTKYTGSSYYYMNELLRNEDKAFIPSSSKNTISMYNKLCTDALEKSRTPEDIIVHRGISDALPKILGCSPKDLSNPQFQESLVGRQFTEKGFFSSGVSTKDAWGGVVLHTVVPKGSKGLYVDSISENSGEHELLLQRNSSFKIREYKLNSKGQITDLFVELVDQSLPVAAEVMK